MASTGPRRRVGVQCPALWAAATAALGWWVASAGCAAGEAGTDDDGAGATGNAGGGTGASTSSTSSSGGVGGATTTGVTGGAGGSAGAGGSVPCTEDPCKLTLPQCGCPADQKCDFHPTDGAYCTQDGTIDGGEQCLGSGCVAGYICAGYFGSPEICRPFCDDDSQCDAPGGLCVLPITGSGASTTICSENCNPITNAGCPVAGMKCDIFLDDGPPERNFTVCVPAGSKTQTQPCTGPAECAVGLSCLTINSVAQCVTWCDRSAPVCPTGSCYQLTPPALVGSVEYGFCYAG